MNILMKPDTVSPSDFLLSKPVLCWFPLTGTLK